MILSVKSSIDWAMKSLWQASGDNKGVEMSVWWCQLKSEFVSESEQIMTFFFTSE